LALHLGLQAVHFLKGLSDIENVLLVPEDCQMSASGW
jgi:hypothetical protein